MNKKKLILFTSQFPYGTGETFLESEIYFLSEAFEEIHIFATAVDSTETRLVPNNVHFSIFSEELSKVEKLQALTLVFSSDYREEKRRAKELYSLEWTSSRRNTALVSLFRARKLTKMLHQFVQKEERGRTVLYSYWCNDSALGLALFRKSDPDVNVVSRAHGWDLYFEATTFNYQPFRKLIAENLSALFPISEKGKEYISERWRVKSKANHVARLGTRQLEYDRVVSKRNIIVSCSNLISLKRVHLIAEALTLLNDVELNWYHFGDGPERESLENKVSEINPERINVHLMGRKKNAQILDWYAQNNPDLFLNVSTTEGIPVSIMEAMSFGVPVFATDVGGTSEIVNNENGLLLSPSISPVELAEKIQNFFQSTKEFREKKRQAAHRTWKTKCNAESNYKQFAQVLSQLTE